MQTALTQPGRKCHLLYNAAFLLPCLYALCVAARIALAFYTSVSPSIMPDEALYLNLSCALARGEGVLLRGQPIHYNYLLYPLLIAPLSALPPQVDLYRAIEVFNALSISAALFPAYAVARRITGSRRAALLVALLTALMPDMLMARHVMVESVSYPMILIAVYLALKMYGRPRTGQAVACALVCALLYTLKPGYIALGAVCLAGLVWRGASGRNKPRLAQACAFALTLAAALAAYHLFLTYGLKIDRAQQTLYATQTHPFSWTHLQQTLNGLMVYAPFLALAFGVFPLFMPAANLRAFRGAKRSLLTAVLLAMAFIVLGSVYIIYVDELGGAGGAYAARVPVRFVAAFLPVMLSFMLAPELKARGVNAPLVGMLALLAALLFVLGGAQALLSGSAYPVDAMLLSALTYSGVLNGRVYFIAFWIAASAVFLFFTARGRPPMRGYLIALALVLIASNAAGYQQDRFSMDDAQAGDARQAVFATEESALGIVRDEAYFWNEAVNLDVASRARLPVMELDDVIGGTRADGTLGALTPPDYWQTRGANPYPAPETLIISAPCLNQIALTSKEFPYTQNGRYALIPLEAGRPWLHSALSGLNQGWVQAGSRFTAFDEALRGQGEFTLQLQARAGEGAAALTLRCGEDSQSFALGDGLSWISATFLNPDPAEPICVELSCEGGNVYVETYLIS